MTKSEYVGFSGSENVYGQKNLLNSQLELLNMAKSFKIYRLLRKEEMLLKVSLKTKIGEALELLKKFEKTLPKSNYNSEELKKSAKRKREDLELRWQIEDIQKKLGELSGS